MREPQAGDIYRWVGLPGQFDTGARIEIGSVSASMKVNGKILTDARLEQAASLVSIGAADFFAAVEHGWLVLDA